MVKVPAGLAPSPSSAAACSFGGAGGRSLSGDKAGAHLKGFGGRKTCPGLGWRAAIPVRSRAILQLSPGPLPPAKRRAPDTRIPAGGSGVNDPGRRCFGSDAAPSRPDLDRRHPPPPVVLRSVVLGSVVLSSIVLHPPISRGADARDHQKHL